MNILIVDNTIDPDSWGSEELQRYARKVSGATVHVRRAPEQDLPADPLAFDRIILSGSKTEALASAPWITKLDAFMRRAIDGGRPLLGVCFGHQMLARVLGGMDAVGKSAIGEVGWTQIEVIGESPLFRGLPRSFYSFSSHYDEIRKLPPGLRCLARSPACAMQAVQLGERPVFGVQFHPERDATGSENAFRVARHKISKEGLDPRTLLHAGARDKFYAPLVAERIFGNFLSL